MERILSAFSDTHTIRDGKAAGLKLVSRGADPNFARGTYEPPMQEAIASNLQTGDVFFDIGANIGFFSLIAARYAGSDGRVYAFEPVPDNAAAIMRSVRLNEMDTVEVFAEAVGAVDGRADLLLARHIGGAVLASAGQPPDMKGKIEIDIVTLDSVIAKRNLRPPSLVKIDVEGAEIDVLKGMSETIQAHHPKIIYEVDDATPEGLRRKADNLATFMSAAGYTMTGLPQSYPNVGWHVEHVFAQPAT